MPGVRSCHRISLLMAGHACGSVDQVHGTAGHVCSSVGHAYGSLAHIHGDVARVCGKVEV